MVDEKSVVPSRSFFLYFVRRVFLAVPTLLGITLVSFLIINLAPGGPLEQKMQFIRYGFVNSSSSPLTARSPVITERLIDDLKKQYGFDQPLLIRYGLWLKNILSLDFGQSFVYEEPVISVIAQRLPISLLFGGLTFFLTYLVSVPLGIIKAVKAESLFDMLSSFVLYVMYTIPTLVLGILLIVFFAGSSYFDWFPIGGVKSDDYESLAFLQKAFDRGRHMVLPLICYVFGTFTALTLLVRNSMLEVLNEDFVRTARAKGLSEVQILCKHALRNALVPLLSGFSGFIGSFFGGAVVIERIFQIDGMGLLGYNSVLNRDFNVVMALIFFSSTLLMSSRLLCDLLYFLIDPRVDFS